MMLCRNGKKVLPFPIEKGQIHMTDDQQQPYGSDSVPQPAQPAQPSYGQDAAQQPQGYGAPQPAAYAQPAAGSYGQQQPQYGQPAGAYAQPQYAQPQYAQPQYGQPQYGQPQYGQPQYGQPAQPVAGCGQQPGYGQAYQQPNAYAQPQYTAAPYAAAPVWQSSKSKLAAGLLGIFLGGLGVHNFYLGNTGKAVAQLLLTLVGWILLGLGPIAAAIWGFVEGIIILCSKPGSPWHKDANGYELSD